MLLASIVQGWCPWYVNNSCYIRLAYSLFYLLRCTVPEKDINGGRHIQYSETHSELLCETPEIDELWDDYGIIDHVKVIILSHIYP